MILPSFLENLRKIGHHRPDMADPEPQDHNHIESAPRLLLEALGKVNLAAGGSLSIIASIVVAKFLPGDSVPLWVVALVGLITVMLFIALCIALLRSVEKTRHFSNQLSKQKPVTNVVSMVHPYAPYGKCRCVLIVSWSASASLPVGSTITLSIKEKAHERPLGFGTVRGVQSDGNAIISLDSVHENVEGYISKLLDEATQTDLLKRLCLGSAFSFQHLESTRSYSKDAHSFENPTLSNPTEAPAGMLTTGGPDSGGGQKLCFTLSWLLSNQA